MATASTAQPGTYGVCVLDLSRDGFVYDPGANVETCEEILVE